MNRRLSLLLHHLDCLVCQHNLGVNDRHALRAAPVDILRYKQLLLLPGHLVNKDLTYPVWVCEKEVEEDALVNLSLLKGGSSVSGKKLEVWVDRSSLVFFGVVVGAVRLCASVYLSAGVHFIVKGVVLLLLPSVRVLASVFVLAPV